MRFKSIRFEKHHFLLVFCLFVGILYIVHIYFPNFFSFLSKEEPVSQVEINDVLRQQRVNDSILNSPRKRIDFLDKNGNPKKNPIKSVPDYGNAFPDLNDVQLITAQQIGVPPPQNRDEAERMKKDLVYVGSSPLFVVKKLYNSIPYLVPHASQVLNEIARAFLDSLQIKGVRPQLFMVTSILRTREDVEKLRRFNGNASENSCHQYGTTFDISYNKFYNLDNLDGTPGHAVRTDTLKWILSEVLRDQRERGMCYVKYEVHQGCFHVTAR